MTTGTDALKIAFRDFLVLNVPSSGPNKPFKAEVRAALNILAEEIAAAASGQNIKVNVRSASTANINLASALVNGAVIDGVTLATGDRFLVKNQSAPSQNGIYIVAASGAASRATDADTADEVLGMAVIVNEGTAWGGWQFNLLTPAPIVIGTTDLNFTPTVNYGEIATSYIQPLLDDAESAAAAAAASAAEVDDLIGGQVYLSSVFTGPITATTDGYVLDARYIDGPTTEGFATKYFYYADVRGTVGSRTVWIAAPGIPAFQISNGNDTGDNYGAVISNGHVTWINSVSGMRTEPLYIDATACDTAVEKIILIIGFGQSTSVGSASLAPVTDEPVKPGFVMMWNGGVRVLEHDHGPLRGAEIVDLGAISKLVDGYEILHAKTGETQWTQAAYECQKRMGDTVAVVAATVGIGSQAYATLGPGNAPFANLLTVVKHTWLAAKLSGRDFDLVAWYPESEGDQTDSEAGFTLILNNFQTNLTNQINPLINRTGQVFVGVDGYSGHSNYGTYLSTQAFAQLAWVLANPTKGIYGSPTYIRETVVDGTHGSSAGNALDGAFAGRATALTLMGDPNPLPLYITGQTVAASYVDFDVHLPKNAVALTSTSDIVTPITNHGWKVRRTDTNAEVTVSSVTFVSGKIRVTVSSPPAGVSLEYSVGWRGVGVAASGPVTGNRSPINDDCADLSFFGVQMANHIAPSRHFATH